MNNITALVFDTPWALVFGALLPILVLALLGLRNRRRRKRLARYGELQATQRLIGSVAPERVWRAVRLTLVALLGGLALSSPRWGLARGASNGRGIDMAIALDASLSMTATDERPSRLEHMKQEVRRLRAMSHADRVALIAFAGRSYILTPLTADDGALELFLDNLDPTIVGQAGSSLARAIRQGSELLLASDGGADRALVLMSDGEAFEPKEDIAAAAEEAGRKGISLVTVGFGTVRGSTIPIREGNSIKEKRDDNGNVVITQYHPETLQAAATAAEGTFVPAEASDKASRIRGALRSLRTARRAADAREDHVPRFTWLLLPALLLLLLDTWLADRGSRMSPVAMRHLASLATVIVIPAMLLGACARAPDPAALFADGDIAGAITALRQQMLKGDSSATVRYNLGSALLGADSLELATQLLEAVRRSADGEVRARARFNAGLAQLDAGRAAGNKDANEALNAALTAYRAYLAERPDDRDAKWNYELALRKPPPQGGGGGGADNQPPDPAQSQPKSNPSSLDPKQAEALLNSAAREERDVQGRKQKLGRTPPPGGKDW